MRSDDGEIDLDKASDSLLQDESRTMDCINVILPKDAYHMQYKGVTKTSTPPAEAQAAAPSLETLQNCASKGHCSKWQTTNASFQFELKLTVGSLESLELQPTD